MLKKQADNIRSCKLIERAPYSKLLFLPSIRSTGIDRNAPNTAIQLIKMGKAFSKEGRICPMISPE